ncbi:MAG TPA: hypothetical protein PKY29_06110 [Ferruginibacter sp.]|nr:hypothetical protein [Ferruginibacter sp.]HRO17705.1 hypothetical protein [Ferruginibacter sp.]HRQ20870.1 hypothetical protein [Ferruginibacter sp.]
MATEKKKLNDKELDLEIRKLWSTGERGKTRFYQLLQTKFKIDKRRCLAMYDKVANEMATLGANVHSSVMTEELKSAVEESIASDLELEAILCKIATGGISIFDWVNNKPVLRDVTPMEMIAAIDKLFKKRGSYAPSKVANTDTNGNDVPAPPVFEIQYKKMPTELLEKYVRLYEEIEEIKRISSD